MALPACKPISLGKSSCTIRFDPTGAFMIKSPVGNLCACSKEIDSEEPAVCDLVCPVKVTDALCECKNPLCAGRFCENPVCKSGDEYFCLQNERIGSCFNIRRDVPDIIYPSCPCAANGTLVNGVCECDEYFGGILCDEYKPPPAIPSGPVEVDEGSARFFFGYGKATRVSEETTTMDSVSIFRDGYQQIMVPIAATVAVFIIIVICAVVLSRRRRAHGRQDHAVAGSTPAPTPTVELQIAPGPSGLIEQSDQGTSDQQPVTQSSSTKVYVFAPEDTSKIKRK